MMAYIGLRKPMIGKRTAAGSYEAPSALGKAVAMDITPNFAEATLYGDDGQAEYIKEFTDADVTLGTSTIPLNMYQTMFGHAIDTEKKSVTYGKDDENGYVGVGIVAPNIVDDNRSFDAMFLPKVKFSDPSDSFETRGDNITFKTPSISGKASAEDSGVWKETASFTTEAAAVAWISEKFGVSGSTGSTGSTGV